VVQFRQTRLILILSLIGVLALSGCAYFNKDVDPAENLPTVRSYHFDNVKIPAQLKLNEHKTFVYDAQGFKAGTLYLSGRVELDSLVNFFTDSMFKDGWRLRSTFRYPKTLLLFERPKMSCIIIMEDKWWTTSVEIWVSPLQ